MKTKLLLTIFVCSVLLWLPFWIYDAVEFHKILNSSCTTTWYNSSFCGLLQEPYTNLRVVIAGVETYTTQNYTGTELWYCCRSYIEGKEFWTVTTRVKIVRHKENVAAKNKKGLLFLFKELQNG